MLFPQNPKIVIVDDEIDDVIGLMNIFSKKGISYSYFDGSMNSEPEKPFNSVRLLILDIDIGKTAGQDDKSKASVLVSYIKKIVSPESNPCVCLFWTRNDGVKDLVKHYFQEAEFSIIFCSAEDKPSRAQLKDMNIEDFERIISTAVSSDIFDYIIDWENTVQKRTSEFVNSISLIAKVDSKKEGTEWDNSIKHILSKLACSYIGTSRILSEDKDNILRYATSILNQSFSESLSEVEINSQSVELPEEPKVSLVSVAQLNSILFIEKCEDAKIENGKVFLNAENPDILELLKNKILSKAGNENCNCQLVSVVLTPSCDLAHKKYLYKDEPKIEFHRILSGIKIEIGDNADYERYFAYAASACSKRKKVEESQLANSLKKEIQKCISCNRPENLYETQPFIDNEGKICVLIFHFGTIQTKEIAPANISFAYLMKNSLISDLQTKLANHVNRLGNSMLEIQ